MAAPPIRTMLDEGDAQCRPHRAWARNRKCASMESPQRLTEKDARAAWAAPGRASHYPSAYWGTIDAVGTATGENVGKRASGRRADDTRGGELRDSQADRRDAEQAAASAASLAVRGVMVMRRFAVSMLVRRRLCTRMHRAITMNVTRHWLRAGMVNVCRGGLGQTVRWRAAERKRRGREKDAQRIQRGQRTGQPPPYRLADPRQHQTPGRFTLRQQDSGAVRRFQPFQGFCQSTNSSQRCAPLRREAPRRTAFEIMPITA